MKPKTPTYPTNEVEVLLNLMLDNLQWKKLEINTDAHSGLYATHESVLHFCGSEIKCYRLNNGMRVLDANDVDKFLAGRKQ